MQNRGMPSNVSENNYGNSYSDTQSPVVQPPEPPCFIQPTLDMKPIEPGMNTMQEIQQKEMQILQSLKNQKIPQEQAEMLEVLKSNPQLMTAFIKSKTAQKTAMLLHERQQQIVPKQNPQPVLNLQQPSQQMDLRQQSQLMGPSMFGEMEIPVVKGQPQIVPMQDHSITNQASSQPNDTLQALLQSLKDQNTPQQQAKVLADLKYNPHLMEAFIKTKTAEKAAMLQQQRQQLMVSKQNPQPVLNLQQSLQQMDLRQQSQSMGSSMLGEMEVSIVKGQPQIVPMQDPSITNQASSQPNDTLQALLQSLKDQNTPQQQAEVLTVLKSNPHLMEAFIKTKTAEKTAMLKQQRQQQMLSKQNPQPDSS